MVSVHLLEGAELVFYVGLRSEHRGKPKRVITFVYNLVGVPIAAVVPDPLLASC